MKGRNPKILTSTTLSTWAGRISELLVIMRNSKQIRAVCCIVSALVVVCCVSNHTRRRERRWWNAVQLTCRCPHVEISGDSQKHAVAQFKQGCSTSRVIESKPIQRPARIHNCGLMAGSSDTALRTHKTQVNCGWNVDIVRKGPALLAICVCIYICKHSVSVHSLALKNRANCQSPYTGIGECHLPS